MGSRPKKVLLLSCTGGYGHQAATHTMIQLLGEDYQCQVIYPINELKILGVPSGESFYNYLLSRNFTHFTNWLVHNFAKGLFHRRIEKTIALIESHIQKEKPDLIISCIPFVNYPVSEAARRFDIPFLLVTVDNDLRNWVDGLEKCRHPRFKITIGSDLPTTRGLLLAHNIPEENIETTGMPLRPAFLDLPPKAKLRAARGISPDERVILLMMGGAGSEVAYGYAKSILQLPFKARLLICTGRNAHLANRLKALTSTNPLEIVPFTEKIHEYMALSDLIITKPGPGTISEAIALKIPILIDRTSTTLFWEKANIDLVLAFGLGGCISSFSDLPHLIQNYLYDETLREKVLRSLEAFPKNQFASRLKPLLTELQEPATFVAYS